MKKSVCGVLAIAAILVSVSSVSMFGRGEKSLYDRLGGTKAITAVVDEFVGRCAADKRINTFFAAAAADPARLAKFKKNLVEQEALAHTWART
jgi:hypothetical protein